MIDPEKVWTSDRLPTLPSVAVELLELSKDSNSDIADFASVIRSDPAMSAKLIKAANSPYFGWSSKISSVDAAILLLGSTAVTSLALSFSLISEHDSSNEYRQHFQDFWSRSLFQAVTAESIAKKCGTGHPAQCFLSGLLCDIGILAQLCTIPSEYGRILDATGNGYGSLLDMEREVLGFDHIEIGTRLMQRWHMPEILIEATRLHHSSASDISRLASSQHTGFFCTVSFAACLGEYLTRYGDADVHVGLLEIGRELLKVDDGSLYELLEEMRTRTDEAAHLMSVDTEMLPRPSELLSLANSQLADIALREHAAVSQITVKTAVLERENRTLKAKNCELHKRAGVDGLTGVNNRGAFEKAFKKMVADSVRLGNTVGVIFADLDHFKHLNDTYGHPFGDEVLRRVSAVLAQQVRQTDFVARYGGEEFVVVASNCDQQIINTVAERIRGSIAAERFFCNQQEVSVTVSMGACVAPPPFPSNAPAGLAIRMLQEADEAMYRSKKGGRNRVNITNFSDVAASA